MTKKPSSQELQQAHEFQAPAKVADPPSQDVGQFLGFARDAIAANTPPETVREYLQTFHELRDLDAAQKLNAALAEFQAGCPVIKKTATAQIVTKGGSRYSYTYADLGQIENTIRPFLRDTGLSYSWTSEPQQHGLLVTCTVRHRAGGSMSASFFAPIDGGDGGRMRSDQRQSGALTLGRRQSLIQALGLVAGDPDTDGDAYSHASGPISEDQWKAIAKALEAVGGDAAAFCRFMRVDSLRDIPAGRYDEAMAAINRKKRAARPSTGDASA